jgi:hypothetical protein
VRALLEIYKPTLFLGVCDTLELVLIPPGRGVPGTMILEADPEEVLMAMASSAAFLAVL